MEEGEMKGREEMKLRREESVLFLYGSAMQHHWRDVFALQHCGIGSAKRKSGFPACAVVS